MPLPVYRLRRLLAATAVLLTVVVAGMYFYARSRVRNVLKEIPNKIGYDIKQTASGFQFSKSDGNRTLFTVQASDVKEFKLNGKAELHNVNIILYGRDASRFDQIYGDDFAYDPKTGDVTAKGDVQIDLVANPAGLASPDQATPKELKNPIHLKTRDLVFNRETGNAWTNAKVEFRTPQATGSAVGVKYAAGSHTLTLSSQLHLVLNGEREAVIDAESGAVTNEPREIVLEHPRLEQESSTMQGDRAVFHLNSENHVQRVVATGDITTETHAAGGATAKATESAETHGHADQAEFLLDEAHNTLRTATLSGNVHFEQAGTQPMQGDAGRVILDFVRPNKLKQLHAVDGAKLYQKSTGKTQSGGNGPQDFALTAPVIDFTVSDGRILKHAVTSGTAQIAISPAEGSTTPVSAQRTIVTAGKFAADFTTEGGKNRLATLHGAPDARIVSSQAGQPDRVSTSAAIDATFLPQGGIESITQSGNVAYDDGQTPDKRMQAAANSARYTPADQMLVLSGSPRVTNGGMATTAKTIRMNRATGDALAEGDVKSTYSELKEQPDGALLASSSPIHVTARSMTAHDSPAIAVYSGGARLWQDANVIEAPSIQFDREQRIVAAQGTSTQPVQTILMQSEKPGKTVEKGARHSGSSPVSITATQLTYADSERKVHYNGGVSAKAADFTASAKTMDVFLMPHSKTSGNTNIAGPGQLDRMVAQEDVVILEPNRRAEGQQLVYTAADDKFVLTGGPPCIFDAEQGKITGVSLTFFRRDDRVLVEGEASTPVVTTTRVAR